MMSKGSCSSIIKIEVCIDKDSDGYRAFCPALKGLHTSGKNEEEVKLNVRYAIQAYLNSLAKHHEPLPDGIIREEFPPKSDTCEQRYVENLEFAFA